jgi:DNA-binding MarR family transcriptional regulator
VPSHKPTQRPSALPHLPLFSLARLGQVARAGLKSAFEQQGLSWRAHVVLLHLDEHAELSQRELAELTTIDASDLVKLLDQMQREGHVQRRTDPGDRRRHVLSITPDGTKTLHKGQRIAEHATADVLALLDGEEQETLLELALRALGVHHIQSLG